MKKNNLFLLAISIFIFAIACEKTYTPEELEYIKKIEQKRADYDKWMKESPNSPFNAKGKLEFHGLKYYDVDPEFVFKSKIIPYDEYETITIFGTKGEERTATRFGYLPFKKDGKDYRVNVYANVGQDSSMYYSIWFTDKTTNKETYGVGRYLSFELKPNKDHEYTIDFNQAFNPYCAYNSNYSCAIPSKEDYIDLAIEAGEKKYHE